MYVFDTGVLSHTCVAGSRVSRVALGKIERGEVFPRARTLDVLANALDVSVGTIVAPIRPLRSVRFRTRTRAHARERILAEVSKWLDACYGLKTELRMRLVRQALEEERISHGHADEILGLGRKEMRQQTREWSGWACPPT